MVDGLLRANILTILRSYWHEEALREFFKIYFYVDTSSQYPRIRMKKQTFFVNIT